ncbi:CRISPR system Cascade subunit CasB [Lentzea jiangxiensis]|uniref:CRISPR system Cascade subunit CasB n=2 Tax=Lentzea jiangxiensis TaxID=641025 RepID=A0A1H0WU22_9PSEU|nr:CRISPR system Cascade subunit CasB [Lentzea jiangxiensis]
MTVGKGPEMSTATTTKLKWRDLHDVGTVVHQRIQALQQGVLANRSSAVAALARLRRGAGKPVGSVHDILQYTLAEEFVPFGAGNDPTVEETAAHISMTLWALHQQSQRTGMHQRGHGLGRAVRRLHPDDPGTTPGPVMRRFQTLGTADSLDELVHHTRGVVQLLRAKAFPLDYALLADELVWWQRPRGAAGVRLRWGREFYRAPQPDDAS